MERVSTAKELMILEGLSRESLETFQYIVIRLGEEQYGIDIKYIDNIVRMQKVTRVPKTQPYFIGVINLRGEIIPVMSLRRRFGLEDDNFTISGIVFQSPFL